MRYDLPVFIFVCSLSVDLLVPGKESFIYSTVTSGHGIGSVRDARQGPEPLQDQVHPKIPLAPVTSVPLFQPIPPNSRYPLWLHLPLLPHLSQSNLLATNGERTVQLHTSLLLHGLSLCPIPAVCTLLSSW